MRLNEVTYTDADPVESYGPGFFRIGAKRYNGAVITGPRGTYDWAGYADPAPLIELVKDIDVLFVGTGAEVAHLPAAFRAALEEAGIGVEAMTSPAAARTYNVLLSEGRRIALALLPV